MKAYFFGEKDSVKIYMRSILLKGAHLKDSNGHIKGNFISYVQRAQKFLEKMNL